MLADQRQNTFVGFLGRCMEGWNRFWFSPGDPTTLGLIRICCGLMVLYIHLAYSYDFQTFFGPNAWLDTKMTNEWRYEIPTTPTVSDWEDFKPLCPRLRKSRSTMKHGE